MPACRFQRSAYGQLVKCQGLRVRNVKCTGLVDNQLGAGNPPREHKDSVLPTSKEKGVESALEILPRMRASKQQPQPAASGFLPLGATFRWGFF